MAEQPHTAIQEELEINPQQDKIPPKLPEENNDPAEVGRAAPPAPCKRLSVPSLKKKAV